MPSKDKLNIILVDVNKIIPYWRNPRRNDKTVDWLCEIIPVYGFNVPIVLDKQNVIVKGHARLKAAKRLGMTQVPCIYSENDDEVNKADRIADNKIQEMSYWDIAKMEMEYKRIGGLRFEKLFHPEEVNHLGFDQDQSISFEAANLNEFGDYFGDDSEASNDGYTGNDPANDGSHSEPFSQGDEGEYMNGTHENGPEANVGEQQSVLPQAKKALKTICPYCGADVYIRL